MNSLYYVSGSSIEGFGLYAARDILNGETILHVDITHTISVQEAAFREQQGKDAYLDYLGNGLIIVMQEPERYINHCCTPNSAGKTVNNNWSMVAIRNIRRGEELTCDYSINASGDASWLCQCGSKECRKTIRRFFDLPAKLQQHYLSLLEPWFIAENKLLFDNLSLRMSAYSLISPVHGEHS